MKVCVQGLWHLGTVTAACLAKAGHSVVGLDGDAEVVRKLSAGTPPLFEPGLEELVKAGLSQGRLRFTADAADALKEADVLWIAFDTPVDEEDHADVSFVEKRAQGVFPHLKDGALVLISSQVPVGTTAGLEKKFHDAFPAKNASFACSPENLRLGKALSVFLEPDRVVVGVRDAGAKALAEELLRPVTAKIEWMSVESAEMTKHAINAFLATSVAFMNELSVLCEKVGVDAKEVERGLKSESRIGPKAYLAPGGAIAGGTLARDLQFLSGIGRRAGRPTLLIDGVRASNESHKSWVRRVIVEKLEGVKGRKLGVLGLTYKPGTDTLRRSAAVELCRWLSGEGATVWAHDPAVKVLPPELTAHIHLVASPQDALVGAEALVVATEWPEYKDVSADQAVARMKAPVVVDPNRFLSATLGADPRVRYAAVGRPA